LDLINSKLNAEMRMGDVASVLSHLEQGCHEAPTSEELNVLGGISRWHDAPGNDFPFVEIFERCPDGTLRHGHYDEAELDFLERTQNQIGHLGLRARVGDLLHTVRPNHLRVRDAVEGYMAFAQSQEQWLNTEKLCRIAESAAEINKSPSASAESAAPISSRRGTCCADARAQRSLREERPALVVVVGCTRPG